MKRMCNGALVALVAVLALSATATASASAGLGWDVEAKELAKAESKTITETATVKTQFSIAWSGVTVRCGELKLKGAKLLGSEETEAGRGEAEHLVLSNCVLENAASKCEVKPIEMSALVLLPEAGVKLKVAPREGTQLGTMTIAGKNHEVCGLAGTYKLYGSLTAKVPGAGVESVKQALVFSGESALVVGLNAASFSGEASVELGSKQAWSID